MKHQLKKGAGCRDFGNPAPLHINLSINPLKEAVAARCGGFFRLKSDMKQHSSFCKKCYSPLEY
ncbi:TPA: hypothetical protein ACITRK_004508, partial [Salmonella enterica subsp. enterica serovar Saintpaul]